MGSSDDGQRGIPDGRDATGAICVQADDILVLDGSAGTRPIRNDGIVEVAAGDAESLSGPLSGNGCVMIEAQAQLYIDAPSIDAAQTIRFDGPNALIVLGQGVDALPVIDGFDAGDGIQLGETAVDVETDIEASGTATVTVTLLDGSIQVFHFDGDYTDSAFYAETQRIGLGPPILRVSEAVACYCRGTLIETDRGDYAVERLRIGDRVRTVSGALEPILWIGRRSYDRSFAAGRTDIQPVRLEPGALGDGLPRRALSVSPRHALLVDGVLIPAGLLVNGRSITQPETGADIHYLHVELDGHHLLLAEGAAAESFADDDSRGMFHNLDEYRALYPHRVTPPPVWCARRIEHGLLLVAAKRRIDALAGMTAPATGTPDALPLRGRIDQADSGRLRGWAWCAHHPAAAVCLEVLIDGRLVGTVLADRYRPDLLAAGIGTGCHGFETTLPPTAPGAVITVRRALDGVPLMAAG